MSLRCPRRTAAAVVFTLVVVVTAACPGCGGEGETLPREQPYGGWEGPAETPREESTEGGGADLHGAETLHMCGRSVLGGWFEHWGWDYDPENPVRFGPRYLVYHEMYVPPEIVDSARDAASEAAEGGGAMFFKLCFDDFAGGDEYSAHENLDANQEIIREVVEDAVEDKGLTLILGNALPKVREYTDEWLVWNHREYNRFLQELAGGYDGSVIILDLYGTLAAPGGWLRPEYADGPYDPHLNAAAYGALDEELRRVLGE